MLPGESDYVESAEPARLLLLEVREFTCPAGL